jgi:diaminopimelate epimerase
VTASARQPAPAFLKMHALGNDFVIFDARREPLSFNARQAAMLVNRHVGIGADQALTLQPSSRADVFLRIQNTDGKDAPACGNATSCVARLLIEEAGQEAVRIETPGGICTARRVDDRRVCLDLGAPDFDWRSFPLANEADLDNLDVSSDPRYPPVVSAPSALRVGSPHVVFFVDELDAVAIASIGPQLERHPMFPLGANIGFAQVVDRSTLRLRVWERSAGLTLACGTGSCAAVIAAHRRGYCERSVTVGLDGGDADVEWGDDGRVRLVAATSKSFAGHMAEELWSSLQLDA